MGSIYNNKRTKRYIGKVDTLLSKQLEDVEWGHFRIEDVLEWQPQKEIDPLKLDVLKDEESDFYPFYGQSTTNNGIISYNQLKTDVLNNIDAKPTILIHSNNQNIVYLKTPFYLKDGHGATSVLQCHKLNDINQMFVVAAIEKIIKVKYNYNNKATKIELKNTMIQLPIKNGAVDFDFMERFIAQLEQERMQTLQAYLQATGLDNYELTQAEQDALVNYNNLEFGKFQISDLFDILSYKKRFDANKISLTDFGHPYVVRTALNNGIKGYLEEDFNYLNEGNTISFGQDTATMFYQEKPYFTGDKIKIMKSKSEAFNKLNSHFFITSMNKSFSSFTWGGSSFNINAIESQRVILPTKKGLLDYHSMELLISAIQKMVIKDVVDYAANKLAN